MRSARLPRLESLAEPPILPVFQLEPLPLTLNASRFSNPHTNTNPNGSYTALYAFRELVDPVPSFSRFYSPSGTSTESSYGQLIAGACVDPASPFAQGVISDAQRIYDQSALQSMGGIPGTWRPVYPTPEDWYDVAQRDRFKDVEIDLTTDAPSRGGFITLPGSDEPERLEWRFGDPKEPRTTVQIDPATKLKSIQFQALRVTLVRPWLMFQVFKIGGWYLKEQPPGLYSSGRADENSGIMPLLTVGLVVGINFEVSGDWKGHYLSVMQQVRTGSDAVSFGPFALTGGVGASFSAVVQGGTVSSDALQVVGWISSLVPLTPKR